MQDYYDHKITKERKRWFEWVADKGFQITMVLIAEKILVHKTFVDIMKEEPAHDPPNN
jgi:hypothetical protein